MRAMEPAARYGYLELLFAQWQSDDCSISAEAIDLAEASGLGDSLWEKMSTRILRNFEVLLNGRLRNAVCFDEWQEAKRIFEDNRQARTEAGKRGANARWGHSDAIAKPSLPAAIATENHGKKCLTGTETVTETKEQKTTPAAFELPAWIPVVTWKDFEETRKQLRAPFTDRAKREIIQKLDELRARGHPPEAVLAQSIARGWRGVFEIKEEANSPVRKRPSEGVGLGKANAERPTRAQYDAWLAQPEEYRKTHRWIHAIPEAE